MGEPTVRAVRGPADVVRGPGGEGPPRPAENAPASRRAGWAGALGRWWLRRSLRARLTLTSTLLLAAGLVAGAALLLAVLERALLGALDTSARERGREVALLVETGRLANPLPVTGGAVVQVVDAQARVRSASLGGDRLVPLLEPGELAAARAGEPVILEGVRLGTPEPLRVLAVAAGPATDPQTVLVAVSTLELRGAQQVVRRGVLAGVPLLLLTLAGLSWLVTGRALRPVATLREGAEEITATGAARRLPLPDAQDEVARLAATLNGMLDRLAAGSARQRAFAADAAHELRSPLASIRTQLEVALHRPGAADWPATAGGVLEDTARMSRLVDDLLVLARLDERAQGGAPARAREAGVDLAGLARLVLARHRDGSVPVTLAAPAEPVLVPGDADALRRVLANLVDNAVRHARTAVAVSVSAGGGGWARVEVRDDGPGIEPADRERVFERFVRLDASRSRDEGGAGLGLAIVREVVAAHGGTVVLEDAAPGVRAVITLSSAIAVPAPPHGG